MHHSGVYDQTLVVLSVLIAVMASYTALDLAARMRATTGLACRAWTAAAALAMGGGIWSMHFVAMLAFSVPGTDVTYDLQLTLLSLVLPIAVTAVGFLVLNRRRTGAMTLGLSGLFMGAGIAGMHYTGMAAMRMSAGLNYDPVWVAVSLVIAVGASIIGLWLAFRPASFVQKLGAAIVMGLAVSGMHYSAMQGVRLSGMAPMAGTPASIGQANLAVWVAGTTFLILLGTLAAAMLDRRLAQRTQNEAAALRQSEERFHLLVKSVTDHAIYMLDPEGRVANWNAGAERIKGYDAHEIVGRYFFEFYTPEDRQAGKPVRALETAVRVGRFEEEGWRLRKDGSRFWANDIIEPIRDDQARLIGFATITRDITERMRTQEALDQARETLFQAQKLDAVGQLTGGVAHDFNNLLMAVLGSLELLRKRLPDDPKLLRLLDNAVQGAQRGASLTQRMLAFARRQHLKPEAVDLPGLVDGMADLLQRSIGVAVHIEAAFPRGLPPALVDANQLELALLNLVVNARDAMPEGGTIRITGREEVRERPPGVPPGRFVCLSVKDSGIGMDDETLAKAQEPFFTTKGVGKGTGLGLSMVQGLAEQSNGRLVLMSRSGEGTTAEIWLPTAQRPGSRGQTPADKGVAVPQTTRALTVLAVDDDPLVLENIATMLEDLGHRSLAARSGQEALDIFARTETIELVITNQAMPRMTGLELAERLASERPGLPVILASGYAELAGQPRLPRLRKPFDQFALALAIKSAVESETRLGQSFEA